MESFLTGLGLSGSAGLNAYLPLVVLGIMHRLGWIELDGKYEQISSIPILALLAVLLIVEMTADKIPAVDTLNDGINTLIRPLAGAILFAASTGSIKTADPALLTAASLLGGGLSAGSIHAVKATVRPGITMSTAGTGNIFVSVIEDVVSFIVSSFAILLPLVVTIFAFSAVAIVGWWVWDLGRVRKYFGQQVAN